MLKHRYNCVAAAERMTLDMIRKTWREIGFRLDFVNKTTLNFTEYNINLGCIYNYSNTS